MDLDPHRDNCSFKIPQTLRSKSNIGKWVDNNDYDKCDYDGDSDTSSSGDSPRSVPNNNTAPSAMLNGTPRREPRRGESPRTKPRVLQNEIKALSGRKFTGTELITYGNKIEEKKTRMIRISGFNANSIKLDEVGATCQESIDQQIDIQCFQEVCRDTRRSNIRQQFLTETKKSDRASKTVLGSSRIDVGSEYKPGGTSIVAFEKTARRVIEQGMDELGRWSWMAFEGEDNKVILVMSIHQCCKNPTNPQGKTVFHQQETMLSEMNQDDCDPRRNFYKDMYKFIKTFVKKEKKKDKQVIPMLIGDWNEECIGKSNATKLCDGFGLVNIFHRKFLNHEKFKTYQEGSTFNDYGLMHKDLIDQVDYVTYEPYGYRKGKGDHRG